MEFHQEIDIYASNFMYQNSNHRTFLYNLNLPEQHATIKLIMPFVDIIVHSTVMIRKERLQDLILYEDLKYGADWSKWLELLYLRPELNIKFGISIEKFVYYLLHDQSMTHNKNESDLDFIKEKRLKIIQDFYSEINQDGLFTDKAVEACTCYILNLQLCANHDVKASEIFGRLKDFYDKR